MLNCFYTPFPPPVLLFLLLLLVRLMATGAADGFFRFVNNGCLSGSDTGIERRPYHRNCRCALHNNSKGSCHHEISKCKTVSYPIRRSWSEGCLALASVSAAASGHSSLSSSSSCSCFQMGKIQQLGLCSDVDE